MADIEKEVKSFNGTVVGNPTLDLDTGIVSGFSASNYLTMSEPFNPGNNPWEVLCKITTGSSISQQEAIFNTYTDQRGFRLGIAPTPNWELLISNGTSWINTSTYYGSYTVLPNTTYWLKAGYDGSNYYLEYSLDGETFTRDVTYSGAVIGGGYIHELGRLPTNGWNGSIDLSKTYININGVRWWTPINAGTYYGSTFKVHQTLPYMFGARGVGYYDSVVSKVPTANEDILLTMKAYDGLTEAYTEGVGTAGKVDFTGTILPWKWDYNSVLDVSKYCLMPSGLTYENIDLGDKERNFNVIGSPTINDSTGIVSGFSSSNYLKYNSYPTDTINSLEILWKIRTPSSFVKYPMALILSDGTSTADPRIQMNPDGILFLGLSNQQVVSTSSLSTNTDYWIKIIWSNSVFEGLYSTDGINWVSCETVSLSSIVWPNLPVCIGGAGTTDSNLPWLGSIYLKDCYININGVRWWTPYVPVHYSLPGCTYNFTDDGSATTLNAFTVQGDKNIVLTPDVEYYGNRYLGTVEIPQHDVYQYNNGTWQNAPHLIGGHTYYFKMIGGGGGSSTWDGGAGAYWEGYYTPAQTVAVTLSQGGGGSGAGAYSRRHNGVKGGTTSIVGEGVSIVCEGGQGAIGLRNGDETGNSSTYTYAPTITITNGTYETIKASTHNRPRRISWDDDTVTGYGAGGQAASGTKAPGNDGLAGYLEYYQVGTITINPTPADALVEMSLDGVEYTTTNSLKAKVDETVYYRVSKEGYITKDTSVLVKGNEIINVELTEEPQP